MKNITTYILLLFVSFTFAQQEETEKALKILNQKTNDLISEANDLASNDAFVSAEMEYRKAISKKPTSVAGTYNLGHSYYKKGNYDEALYRNQQAAKSATDKLEKHKAFHNIGNILMQEKKCREASEAFKNALRNNPLDEETRYNYALAKECAKKEEPPQEDGDDNKEDKEDEKDKDNKEEGDNKEDKEDKGDKDKKEGDDKEEEGKPDKEKEKDGKGDDQKKEQPKPQQQPGKLSPQQIKNLLEAMDNQEQKVQEKINAEKAKGAKVQTEKDW